MPNESGNLGAALEDLDDIRVVGSVAFLVGSGDGVSDFLVSCVVVCVLVEGFAIVWSPRPRIHHAPEPGGCHQDGHECDDQGRVAFPRWLWGHAS